MVSKVSQLEVFRGVSPGKERLAAEFKGMALGVLAEAPNDAATRQLVDDYLARAVRVLGEGCKVVLAQGAAGGTGVRKTEMTYQGSLGQPIMVEEVVAYAAPVVESGWEDRSHQVVVAQGLHSPEAGAAIEVHATHLAVEQGYGREGKLEYSLGVRGVFERAVNAAAGRPVLGTQEVTTNVEKLQRAASVIGDNIRYNEGRRLVAAVEPAAAAPAAVRAEIAAARAAEQAGRQRIADQVAYEYGPGGAREGKCLIDP